jgi:putative protease
MAEKPAGKVEHYYPKVQAAAVKLSKKVKLGDEVHIVGHGDDFKEKVTSLQLDHQPIQEGQPGQSVGLWVKERVHEGDDVLLVTPDSKAAKPAGKAKPAKAAKKAKKARAQAAKASKKAAKKAVRKSRRAAKKFGKALARSQKKARKASGKATRKASKKRR